MYIIRMIKNIKIVIIDICIKHKNDKKCKNNYY